MDRFSVVHWPTDFHEMVRKMRFPFAVHTCRVEHAGATRFVVEVPDEVLTERRSIASMFVDAVDDIDAAAERIAIEREILPIVLGED